VPIATSTVCTAFISDKVIERQEERGSRREGGLRGRSVSKLEK
jgi:hypothetical protein